jgi:uncharacterized CHY-type Zn-finger protein
MLDNQTRCKHYHSALDIIAIKFKCCHTYYPCFKCHQEEADHQPERWKKEEWNEKAILCGVCKTELSIQQYFDSKYSCPCCSAAFNPGCIKHHSLYFDVSD